MKLQSHSEVRGVALVIVLAFLVLMSVLIISFFTNVTGEVTAGRSTVSATRSLQLADSAVQLVMGQIREGTSQGGYTAWASQPGLIRTYGTGTAASTSPLAFYKLYSSHNMVVGSEQLGTENWNPEEADVDVEWPAKRALFTDLNEPVLIQDPTGPISVGGESYSAIYPIVDPLAQPTSPADIDGIAGFRIETPPGYGGVNPPPRNYNPTVAPADSSATSNPAPMPVRWIYVLNDGTLTTPTDVDASGLKVNWAGGTVPEEKKPSVANPIVGRIAFWTDDDTSKVNINTATGDQKALTGLESGAFWDQPRVNTHFDQNLARSQVAQFEFQRYPGHPATIGLSSIFPDLNREQLAGLSPRVAFGGSQGGSVLYVGAPVSRKEHRLYASVDELMFKMPSADGAFREPNLPGTITSEALNRSKFFLTAHSRVPEVNLFGRPRVSIWPIHEADSPLTRNASDNLLAFCSTIGQRRYYFTRGAANAETNTSRDADYEFNERNRVLYNYLRQMTSKAIPGFADRSAGVKTFETKYTAQERDQILTEIFDYIRCFNLHDGLLMRKPGGRSFTPKKGTSGSGQVVPIQIATSASKTNGFGRFATISEAALLFYATRIEPVSRPGAPSTDRTTKMRAVLLLETFSPAQGHTGLVPDLSYTVSGLDKLSVKVGNATQTLKFPAVAENRTYRSSGIHSRIWSGTEGISNNFYQASGAFKSVPGLNPNTNYPFISQLDVDLGSTEEDITTMDFSGGRVTVDIAWKNADGSRVEQIQKLAFDFPPLTKLPLPKRPEVNAGMDFNHRIRGLNNHYFNAGTGGGNATQNWRMIVDANDVVRSLEPSGADIQGDLRLIAARSDVRLVNAYGPHQNYFTANHHAHSLRLGTGDRYPGLNPGLATTGKLVAGVSYNGLTAPDFPSSIGTGALIRNAGTVVALGDWDTGMAAYMDGPYINKPDEGTTSGATGTTDQTPYYTNTDEFNAPTFYSPNRQAHSPVLFGSLSTGVIRKRPWQTLLFRPDATAKHPGSFAPKDHLLLDLFTMPIVEPYAISEPFSTAGKVNMNYQIAPFGYIRRETAMRAALQSIWTMGIPANASNYKSGAGAANFRYPVDIDLTLTQFQERFDENRIFVSASEICDLELAPKGVSLPGSNVAEKMRGFWNNHTRTGDNVREMPYAHLHPLLTTKSNTFTVHLRVQALQKSGSGNPQEWEEGKDQVLSEYRGSSTIERYVDPDDPLLPDFATVSWNDAKGNLEQYYRMRVIGTKKFAP